MLGSPVQGLVRAYMTALPLENDPDAEVLTSPRIQMNVGQTGAISIGSDQDLEYFVPSGRGLYELKHVQQPTGVNVKLTVQKDADGGIFVEKMTVSLKLVASRKPLTGTSLNVGEPVILKKDVDTSLHMKPGQDYSLPFTLGEGQGSLVIKLRADWQPTKTGMITPISLMVDRMAALSDSGK